jgi:hypothetical protein
MWYYLFTVNEKSAYALQKEFNLSDYDKDYIYHNFWPIIIFNDISIDSFKNYLEVEKNKFIQKNGKFDLDIFERDYLVFLVYEINSYLDNIKKGQSKFYQFVNDVYFHWFKLKEDKYNYTLILSKKDIIGLEMYFKDLLNTIKSFVSSNQLASSESKKPKQSKASKQSPKKLRHSHSQSESTSVQLNDPTDCLEFFRIELANNNSKVKNYTLVSIKNWDSHKDIFFKQRMANYSPDYTLQEKINLELKRLNKLIHIGDAYGVLKDRYIDLLKHKSTNVNSDNINNQNLDTTNKQNDDLVNKINNHFAFFYDDCPRRSVKILSDDEADQLIDWTIYFYKNKFKLPEIKEPIKQVNTNKSYVRLAFRYLFKELHPNKKFPNTLFEFYRSAFKQFRYDNESNFYKEKKNQKVRDYMKL